MSIIILTAFLSQDAIESETVDYKHGDVALQGYLARPKGAKGRLPAVILVHEWRGHGDYVRMRADKIARLGYVAFAIDMYGKGVYAKDHAEAGKLAGVYFEDRRKMRERAAAAVDLLKNHPLVDLRKIAAIGYCFGGTTALEMARAGMNLVGVVSFHGNLSTPDPDDARNIKGRVLVCHGADDTFIPAEQVATFQEEMRKAKVDWQFISYGGAVHSFTVQEAGNDPSKGMAYDEKADRRSWKAMTDFLEECFK